jgi:hypothetical protein
MGLQLAKAVNAVPASRGRPIELRRADRTVTTFVGVPYTVPDRPGLSIRVDEEIPEGFRAAEVVSKAYALRAQRAMFRRGVRDR